MLSFKKKTGYPCSLALNCGPPWTMSSKVCIGYMKTWMLSTNIEVIMIHLPCCTSLVRQMVALWMIALYSGTSEYGRTLAKKIRLRRLNQPKIPYIRTKPSPSGPENPYLRTGIWSFLGPKIPYFPDRHMRELPGASEYSRILQMEHERRRSLT